MVYKRLVPVPAHRLNRRSSNARALQQGGSATEQRLTQLERDNAALVAADQQNSRISHFIGFGALVVAIASAWGGYQFNTWQQNNATELAVSQDIQDKLAYSAFLNMACVLQAQQAVLELQYRPQAASQIFDALKMNEAKCQAVGVPLTARAAWLVKKYPERLDRKVVERAGLIIKGIPPRERARIISEAQLAMDRLPKSDLVQSFATNESDKVWDETLARVMNEHGSDSSKFEDRKLNSLKISTHSGVLPGSVLDGFNVPRSVVDSFNGSKD